MVLPARRRLLRLLATAGALPAAAAASPPAPSPRPAPPAPASPLAASSQPSPPLPSPVRYDPVVPGTPLRFPRDHGAHPGHRTEWWYVTGWLRVPGSSGPDAEIGVQVTFFRSRTGHSPANPSRFAPGQLVLAHAALALPSRGRLLHAERAARAGFGLAGFSEADTSVRLDGWTFERGADDRYAARIAAPGFSLDLAFAPGRPPVLQGDAGFSRKGPRIEQASHYYSRPQLRVEGSISVAAAGRASGLDARVEGTAWLDHEWSSEILDRDAAGWDWVGLNFDDGRALMAFRIRGRDGSVRWSHARWIAPAGAAGAQPASPPAGAPPARIDALPAASAGAAAGAALDAQARFEPLRAWRSPRTGASWPVAMRLDVGARSFELAPLFDDQELDGRTSTGIVYWEGAVRVLEHGRPVGHGYLELTGYWKPVKL